MENVIFLYDLKKILFYIIVGLLFAISLPLIADYQNELNETSTEIIIGIVVMSSLVAICYLIIKRLIPALKGQPTLILTESVFDFRVNNIQIFWKDIQDIELRSNNSKGSISWFLYFSLKKSTSYNDDIKIELTWIDGNPETLYEKINNYFLRVQQCYK